MILPKICMHGFESELYFHVPVWADLIRVLAHACAWENSFLVILPKICMHNFESALYFHVPRWANLIRVLAHACAWENI